MSERPPIERLGEELARVQDEALDGRPLPPLSLETASPARRPVIAVALASVLLLGVAGVALYLRHREPALSVEIDGNLTTDPSSWISVAPASETPLRFSDGSTLLLLGDSRSRVVSMSARGAHVQVERGRAVVSVVHREGAEWRLDVGPFRVDVTGTRFEVGWDQATGAFNLSMQEGSVRVRGPGVKDKILVAGQSMAERVGPDGAVSPRAPPPLLPGPFSPPIPSSAPTPPAATPPPAAPVARPDQTRKRGAIPAPPPPAPAPAIAPAAPAVMMAPPPVPGFRELYSAGEYGDALAVLKGQGIDKTLKSAPAGDLLILGDAARLAGDQQLSRQALETARQRFPGSAEAARACFLLGRIAFDVDGHPAEAAKLFARYLEEAPEGPLAREALGRLMEALARAGERSQAEARAKEYLQRYPNGPYAALARSLMP